jgi:predicted kinase
LVVVSGLPGTGKSSVSVAVAARTGAVHLSVDHLEDALLEAGLQRGWTTGMAAYEVVRAAAEQNLALGRLVIVDAVNDSEAARDTWRRAARESSASLVFVLLTPPEPSVHRTRLEGRQRTLRQVPEPTWEQVEQRARSYEPWRDEPLVIDSGQSLDAVVQQVIDAMSREQGADQAQDPSGIR